MKNNVSRFLKRVGDSQYGEINCSTCLKQINAYVDLELTTGKAAERMPRVKQHLDQCGVCFEEYQLLRDLAQLEAEDSLPTIEELSYRLKGNQKES